MEKNRQNTDEIEINLLELARELWKNKIFIICAGIICAMAAILIDKLMVTPQYISTTKLYVLAQQDRDKVTSGDLQVSTLLTKDYAELIKSRKVTEEVISQLGLKSKDQSMTHEQLLGKLTVEATNNTRIVTIKVQDSDPYRACEIANAVRDAAAVHIQNVMMTEAVNVVDEANVPKYPSSPSIKRDGMAGGIAGMFAAAVIVFIIFLMNDTIQTREDVDKYLGISTLGLIPTSESETKVRRKKRHR